jgi:hypothetical protein
VDGEGTFSLEITSIKLESIDNNIRLHLKPKMPLEKFIIFVKESKGGSEEA